MKKVIIILALVVQTYFCEYVDAQNTCFRVLSSLKQRVSGSLRKPNIETAKLSNYNFISCKKAECYCINKSISDGNVFYTLQNGGSNLSSSALNYPELINVLSSNVKARGRSDVYLDLSGFSKDEHTALVTSCESRINSSDEATRIITNDRSVSENIRDDFSMNKGKKVTMKDVGEIKLEKIGGRNIFNRTIEFTVGIKNYVVRVFSYSRQLLMEFVDLLTSRFRLLAVRPESLADVISSVKTEIMEKHKVSAKDFYIEMDDEFGGSMIVRLKYYTLGQHV